MESINQSFGIFGDEDSCIGSARLGNLASAYGLDKEEKVATKTKRPQRSVFSARHYDTPPQPIQCSTPAEL